MGYVIAFFILCGVVGLAVFVVAFAGGRRRTLPGESALAGRGIILAVIVAFAFGLVVPVLILYENGKHHASTAAGVHLTSAEVRGREDFVISCSVCHTLKATSSFGHTASDLDVVVPKEPTGEARKQLVLKAILEGAHSGEGNMDRNYYEGREAEDVAEFVAAVAGHSGKK
jgi:mono/diheme cytochrome c family protein